MSCGDPRQLWAGSWKENKCFNHIRLIRLPDEASNLKQELLTLTRAVGYGIQLDRKLSEIYMRTSKSTTYRMNGVYLTTCLSVLSLHYMYTYLREQYIHIYVYVCFVWCWQGAGNWKASCEIRNIYCTTYINSHVGIFLPELQKD